MVRNKKLLALLDKLTDIVDSIRAELENGNNDEEEDDAEIQFLDSCSVEKFDVDEALSNKDGELLSDNRVDSIAPARQFDIKDIVGCVGEVFNIEGRELFSSKRAKNVVMARRVAIYLCRDMTRAGLLQIAKVFNLKDHTAVIQAQRRISEQLKTDTELQHTVEDIKAKLLH